MILCIEFEVASITNKDTITSLLLRKLRNAHLPVTSMPVKEKEKAEKLRKQTENPDATGGDEKREHAYSFDIMNPPSF